MNQQQRIWRCEVDRHWGNLWIEAFPPDPHGDLLTVSQVQDTIRNGLPDGNEGVFEKVSFHRETDDHPVPTEQELVLIAQSCQPFLADDMEKMDFWGFTDASVCHCLQNMDLSRDSTLKQLYIFNHGLQSMTETIAWVQNGPLCSVGAFVLSNVELCREDCRIIGQTISDRGSRLCFRWCSFPSCRDFLALTAGIVNGKIRRNPHGQWTFWTFFDCVLEDETIPSLGVQDDSTLNCYSIFAVLWNRYSDMKKEDRLDWTAAAFLDYFEPFHEAGLSNLVRFGEQGQQQQRQSEPRDWIAALAHDAVRDREDLLFHFLTLNPELYATEALKRLGRS